MKPKKHLGFNGMRTMLSSCFNQIPEHRQSNKITYSAHDALMSGFACMHFQDPSLLQFQKRLEKKHHKSNLQTLFNIKSIPESTQLRTIIDGVDSDYFGSFFDEYTHYLQRGKHLTQYQLLDGLYYIPMDATDYFSSYACSCDRCLRTKSKKKPAHDLSVEPRAAELEELYSDEEDSGVRYSHKALQIAIIHPDMKQVIPLMPEEIRNTDGATKQDCEMNAGKRLIPKLRKAHPQLGIILGGDDSYGHGDKNLCFNFYLLTLIAFSFHQVYELTDKVYQACRQHFGSKKHLWENVRANLRTFIFVSWDYLLAFTLDPEKYITGELPAPS